MIESKSLPALRRTFLSCGDTFTDQHKQFVAAIEAHMQKKGCEIFTVGKHNYSARQPVEFARDLVATCDSAIVIAFERYRIQDGLEYPGSSKQKEIHGRSEPTIWNQLEAALAYAHHLPILVMVDRKIERQGMLSKRFEWNAFEVDIDPSLVQQEDFRQIVDDWLTRVDAVRSKKAEEARRMEEASKLQKKRDLEEITLGEFFSSLKAKHAWAISAAVFTAFAAVAGAAFYIGQISAHTGK